jgi:hypothetical protein
MLKRCWELVRDRLGVVWEQTRVRMWPRREQRRCPDYTYPVATRQPDNTSEKTKKINIPSLRSTNRATRGFGSEGPRYGVSTQNSPITRTVPVISKTDISAGRVDPAT